MKTPNTTESVRALISNGFTTKVSKKEAGEKLNRVWDGVRGTGYELPFYAHQVTAKVLGTLSGTVREAATEVRELYLAIKATEVVKAAAKLDDTKVREVSPEQATIDGIDFIDMKGDRRGYCYCCGRAGFKLNGQGRLSRHGYQRPGWGFDVGGCYGTKLTPAATLAIAIRSIGEQIDHTETLLATTLWAELLRIERRQVKQDQRLSKDSRWSKMYRESAAERLRKVRNESATYQVQTLRSRLEGELSQLQDYMVQLRKVEANLAAA
jgi:hypothetical protein